MFRYRITEKRLNFLEERGKTRKPGAWVHSVVADASFQPKQIQQRYVFKLIELVSTNFITQVVDKKKPTDFKWLTSPKNSNNKEYLPPTKCF